MRLVVQRVSEASVEVDERIAGAIGIGLLALVGVGKSDTRADAEWLADKLTGLRVFPDREGKMNLDVQQAGGALLLVSQFTLYGDCRRGRRPSFDQAAEPATARALYEYLVEACRKRGVRVETGVFQASMSVRLLNQGPVTLLLDSAGAAAGPE